MKKLTNKYYEIIIFSTNAVVVKNKETQEFTHYDDFVDFLTKFNKTGKKAGLVECEA